MILLLSKVHYWYETSRCHIDPILWWR